MNPCRKVISSTISALRARSSRARLHAAISTPMSSYFTGKVDGQPAIDFPFPVDRQVLQRGQQRYDDVLFALSRSGRHGTGHDRAARLSAAAVIAYRALARCACGPFLRCHDAWFRRYAGLCRADFARDRWAIAAYIRALQLSQNAAIGDVPEGERRALLEKQTMNGLDTKLTNEARPDVAKMSGNRCRRACCFAWLAGFSIVNSSFVPIW